MSKRFSADYLNFTRKERVGIIIVLILIIFFLLLPFLYSYFRPVQDYDHREFEKEIALLEAKQAKEDSHQNYVNHNFDEDNYQNYYQPSGKNNYNSQLKTELFYFDPNTLSVEGWKKLGIRDKTANTIQNYLARGGRFKKPEDINKIWGLYEDEIKRLLPYVRIEPAPTGNSSDYKKTESSRNYQSPEYSTAVVDINEADTAAFIALPGIGSKLANRIISFREKLGGFYKIEQVAETYALPDSTFQKIKDKLVVANTDVKKLDINNATVDELKSHPYIRYNIANAIVQYRTQHGSFSSVNDIKKIMLITDEVFNKAAPYLTIR